MTTMASWNPIKTGPESNRRRSQRVVLSAAITVCTQGGPADASFREDAQTLVVNAHGCLIALAAKVVKGQKLLLINWSTHEEQLCQVIYSSLASGGKTQVGIEFTTAAPNFWRIAFPPEDWIVPDNDQPSIAGKKK